MYLIDTNIFLEVMLSQAKSPECEAFLSQLKTGRKRGFITDFSVHSIMIIMDHHGKKDKLKDFLKSLPAYDGLTVYSTTLSDKVAAIDLCAKTGLDIEDSIQYSAALALGVEGIVSLDKHFDGLDVKRVEP
jgi:predicted nucleic acid-binding protein